MYNVKVRRERRTISPLSILVILISMSICMFLSVKAFGFIKTNPLTVAGIRKDIICAQVLNITMPIIKDISFEQESMVEESIDINPFKLNNEAVSMDNSDSGNESGSSVTEPKPQAQDTNNAAPNPSPANNASNNGKPRVLIYHTHSTEAYQLAENFTNDQSKSVCAVGDVLADSLEKDYKITTVHDKTMHDAAYLQAYQRAGETVDKYLKAYGNFDMIIDLHRDSITDKKAVTTKINGENVATIRFVMAKANPHFDKNMEVVNGLINIAKKLNPNYCRGIYYYNKGTNYFNQAKSNNAFLVEVGSTANSLDEAKTSGKYLAKIISTYLNSK